MEYDALRRLVQVKDWLGDTIIQRDIMGRPKRITDHEGREVCYEWGAMNERRSMSYPDGRKVSYHYNENLNLMDLEIQTQTGKTENIHYFYDNFGRLIQKEMSGGLRTVWKYHPQGQLAELIHTDKDGILDKYSYEYDLIGNKTAIRKERRGLEAESGSYGYTYDALGRLEGVAKDGENLRRYTFDAFGNRKEMREFQKSITSYTYDALDRMLTAQESSGSLHEYRYDKRGNLTEELINGQRSHAYTYGAMNRLSRAESGQGVEALYQYNGLGQRTGRTENGVEERYLLDLSRPYHNLLGYEKDGRKQNFYWDGNVVAMEALGEDNTNDRGSIISEMHYYLQDELGSPIRVSGYEELAGANYLTYGYDEFGNDLYKDLVESGIPNPYVKQGEEQPFGYTGYRKDTVSGTYFAQAREYYAETGRFTAEDVVRGSIAVPMTLNRYGYCWGNPVMLVDYDGKFPWLIIPAALAVSFFLSGCGEESPYKYSPEVYNSEEYVKRTNCYAYAFDIINNPLTGDDFYTKEEAGVLKDNGIKAYFANQPGLLSGQRDGLSPGSYLAGDIEANNKLIQLVTEDATAIGLDFQEYEEGMEGGYKVLLVVNPWVDYHWYRQDADGTWSHKQGSSPVISGIKNPEEDAKRLNYEVTVGYFYIKEKCEIE